MSDQVEEISFPQRVVISLKRKNQILLDKSTVHVRGRWGFAVLLLILYCVRVYLLSAFYIVTYGLGIYLLNLFIGFLSPQIDPDIEGPVLPSAGRKQEEFRPFSRRVPEFTFWYNIFSSMY